MGLVLQHAQCGLVCSNQLRSKAARLNSIIQGAEAVIHCLLIAQAQHLFILVIFKHNKLMHPMRDDESRYTNLDRRSGFDSLFLRECAELRKASDWLKITWM